ncbi:hypothetical protein PRJ39_16465 [Lysobacter enzymogenes]|uniref:hypothetical protein n=1 Tax=Lysobacter enzymogenes TaxID=69 RepID=UPI003748A23F
MKGKTPQDVAYEKRMVLFLDFLGFKEIVKATAENPAEVARVVKAIDRLKAIGKDTQLYQSQRMTQFSDCVVVSYRCDERSAAFELVSEIAFALVDLVEQGFLVRGGVAVGDLVHTDEYLFGPAMNEAYELESRCAVYPRVLVGETLLDAAGKAPAEHHGEDEERRYVKDYLRKDSDGFFYIDYVSWRAVVGVIGGENDLYGCYLEKISELLKRGFSAKSVDVLQKYRWLRERYAAEVKKIAKLPPDHDWVRANPDMYEGIKALPLEF